jgi:hypothetical protein
MAINIYSIRKDTKMVTRIRISKDRQHNGQKKKYKRTKERSTKHTHNTKDRVTRASRKTGGAPEGLAVPALLVVPVVLI